MYKDCRTEQSAQRQRDLEKGLLAAMKQQRFEDISVSDLCDGIGVPRKSFYRYFSGKEGALHALIDHTLLEYDGFVLNGQENNQTISKDELERFFLFWHNQKTLLDALARSGLYSVLFERMVDQAITEAIAPRPYMSHYNQDLRNPAILFTVCGLMSLATAWHRQGFTQDYRHLADMAMKLVTEPLLHNPEM